MADDGQDAIDRQLSDTTVDGGFRVDGGRIDSGNKRAAPDSRVGDIGMVHTPKPLSAQEHGALRYSVADAAENRMVPQRPAHAIRPTAAEELSAKRSTHPVTGEAEA